jgi:mannose-6-phosphate isomerase-like protein (cupin superfamily)
MKFTLEKANKFGWEGLKGFAYNSSDDFSRLSGAYFEVTSSHGKVKTSYSDRIYYVIEGNGEFIVDDSVIEVAKTDVIIIPKNTPYDYKAIGGVMKLFLVHSPAYNPDAEEKLS